MKNKLRNNPSDYVNSITPSLSEMRDVVDKALCQSTKDHFAWCMYWIENPPTTDDEIDTYIIWSSRFGYAKSTTESYLNKKKTHLVIDSGRAYEGSILRLIRAWFLHSLLATESERDLSRCYKSALRKIEKHGGSEMKKPREMTPFVGATPDEEDTVVINAKRINDQLGIQY